MRIRTRQTLGAAASAVVLAGTLGVGVARADDPPPPVSAEECESGGGSVDVLIGDDSEPALVCSGGEYDGAAVDNSDVDNSEDADGTPDDDSPDA
ncbi:hypothetical protein [Streptomyces sp. URMC 124]|uniref:hypothetical protein n=1 Tax=Streptomyces sp. URMC 124 TaxID=3423405 RepID=UPI003F199134